MKKYLIAALLASTVMSINVDAATATVSNAKVEIDNAPITTPVDVHGTQKPTFNINNRLYLPLRHISNELNCKVEYDQSTMTISILKGLANEIQNGLVTPVEYIPGSVEEVKEFTPNLLVDGKKIDLGEYTVFSHKGTTYVPLRLIAEALDVEVDWVQTLQTARIMTTKSTNEIGGGTEVDQEGVDLYLLGQDAVNSNQVKLAKTSDGYMVSLTPGNEYSESILRELESARTDYKIPDKAGEQVSLLKLLSGKNLRLNAAGDWIVFGWQGERVNTNSGYVIAVENNLNSAYIYNFSEEPFIQSTALNAQLCSLGSHLDIANITYKGSRYQWVKGTNLIFDRIDNIVPVNMKLLHAGTDITEWYSGTNSRGSAVTLFRDVTIENETFNFGDQWFD